jgi:hypothetical protein
MNHPNEEQLVLHYYAEAEDEAAIESHLADCDNCRAAYRELQQTLALVSAARIPERPEDYGSAVWKKIQPSLGHRFRLRWSVSTRARKWALAATMAVLVLAAFLIGRFLPREESQLVQERISNEAVRRILLVSAADHLERSQIVLTDLVHAAGKGTIDISAEQAWARELLDSNRIYRQAAERAGETWLAVMLDDLERTLLDVVHSPASPASGEFTEIQRQIESDGLLFKLRVAASRLRERHSVDTRVQGRSTT